MTPIDNCSPRAMMNSTIELLKFVGSPFASTNVMADQRRIGELCITAKRNRMLFFYLHKLGENLEEFADLHSTQYQKYKRTNEVIARISRILATADIKYAYFKTIRPYTSTTVDLDILIFGKRSDYARSLEEIHNGGYKPIACGPRSTTFWDQRLDIGIDIYEQIAVSFFIYMDKTKLEPHVTTTKLPNDAHVHILKPEADLACIIAHSIIKEQMYTLSEYCTFINYINKMKIRDFLAVLRNSNITQAASVHTAITALLHMTAHGIVPEPLSEIMESLNHGGLEIGRLVKRGFRTPHKYHTITSLKSLLELIQSQIARKSVAEQLYHMLNPDFSKDFLRKLIDHVVRETY